MKEKELFIWPLQSHLSSPSGAEAKEGIKCGTRKLHMPWREEIIATGRQKKGSNLDWRIWEGLVEEVACELRLKDRWWGFQEAEVKETCIQGQKEKDTFQAEETTGAKEQGSKAM